MTDLRQAAEQALEALEYYRSFEDCQPTPASKTIPALRQALAQPKREWVGLTDDEIEEIQKSLGVAIHRSDFRAIEAKLKDKNGG